jgi:hypothetical protein
MKSGKKKSVVIIGAGLAGTCIANSLVKTMNVFILDKGPSNDFIKPKNEFINKQFGESDTYVNGVGGTTHLWHNGLMQIRPNKVKGQFRTIVEKAEPYLNKAASALGLKGEFDKNKNSELDYYLKIYQQQGNRNVEVELDTIIVPKTTPLKELHEDIQVFPNSKMKSYVIAGGKVRVVNFISLGKTHNIECDYLVISSGGIGSVNVVSSLLEMSGIKTKNLGKGLIDHPMGFLGKIKVKKNFRQLFQSLCHHEMPEYTSRCGIVVKSQELNHIFYFRPAMSMTNNLAIYKFKSALGGATWKQRFKMMLDPKFYHPDILIEIFSHLFKVVVPTRHFAVWGVFEQKRSLERSISVTKNDTDYIDWSISDSELDSYSEALNILESLLLPYTSKMKVVSHNLDQYLWSAAHHSSTMSYGTEDWELDDNLKLNAFKNVYVCDGSVIEQNAYVNTGLLIAQLSQRLSDHLIAVEE